MSRRIIAFNDEGLQMTALISSKVEHSPYISSEELRRVIEAVDLDFKRQIELGEIVILDGDNEVLLSTLDDEDSKRDIINLLEEEKREEQEERQEKKEETPETEKKEEGEITIPIQETQAMRAPMREESRQSSSYRPSNLQPLIDSIQDLNAKLSREAYIKQMILDKTAQVEALALELEAHEQELNNIQVETAHLKQELYSSGLANELINLANVLVLTDLNHETPGTEEDMY